MTDEIYVDEAEAREILGCDPCEVADLRPAKITMNGGPGAAAPFYWRLDVERAARRLRDAQDD